MQDRSLITLSIILAVVLAASAVVYYWDRTSTDGRDPLGIAEASQDVSQVRVNGTYGVQTAERTDSGWQVAGKLIKADQIHALLSGLSHASDELVSHNGRTIAAFGFTGTTTPTIAFTTAGTERVFDVGARDRRTGGVYIANHGADSVYLLYGTTLDNFIHTDFTTWYPATSTAATSTSATTSPSSTVSAKH